METWELTHKEFEVALDNVRTHNRGLLVENTNIVMAKIDQLKESMRKKNDSEKEIGESVLNAQIATPYDEELSRVKEEYSLALAARKHLLEQDIIYPKYHNWVAYCTFCEYLETGRCEQFTGPNGAYNLYESELRANLVIGELKKIVDSLEEIKSNQYMMYEQMQQINVSLNQLTDLTISMNQKLDAVVQNTEAIAYNTAVSAYYSKVNAELTDAMGFMIAMN